MSRRPRGPGARLSIRCRLGALVLGESIAIDGACLTVDQILADGFEADASAETLARCTLGAMPVGARVNLERAMQLGGRLGGHLVSGHVDGVGTLVASRPLGDALELTFSFPEALASYIAEKGSITVSGVSLTVNTVVGHCFSVVVVPHTRSATSLDAIEVGAQANLEVDILARYVARLLGLAGGDAAAANAAKGDAAWLERLQRAGYM